MVCCCWCKSLTLTLWLQHADGGRQWTGALEWVWRSCVRPMIWPLVWCWTPCWASARTRWTSGNVRSNEATLPQISPNQITMKHFCFTSIQSLLVYSGRTPICQTICCTEPKLLQSYADYPARNPRFMKVTKFCFIVIVSESCWSNLMLILDDALGAA